MAYLTYTHTLVNGATGNASQVQTNFNDFKSAITDGTLDMNIAGVSANSVLLKNVISTGDGLYDIGTQLFRYKDLYASGEVKGERVLYTFGTSHNTTLWGTTPRYLGIGGGGSGGGFVSGGTNIVGITATRAGSIVGLSFYVADTGYTVTGTLTPSIYVNGVSVFSGSAVTVSSTGEFQTHSTQARGTDTFVAGNKISAVVTGNGVVRSIGHMTMTLEVILDT